MFSIFINYVDSLHIGEKVPHEYRPIRNFCDDIFRLKKYPLWPFYLEKSEGEEGTKMKANPGKKHKAKLCSHTLRERFRNWEVDVRQ